MRTISMVFRLLMNGQLHNVSDYMIRQSTFIRCRDCLLTHRPVDVVAISVPENLYAALEGQFEGGGFRHVQRFPEII